jgi:hypothetical protein
VIDHIGNQVHILDGLLEAILVCCVEILPLNHDVMPSFAVEYFKVKAHLETGQFIGYTKRQAEYPFRNFLLVVFLIKVAMRLGEGMDPLICLLPSLPTSPSMTARHLALTGIQPLGYDFVAFGIHRISTQAGRSYFL